MLQANLKLAGRYSVDVFKGDGSLRYSIGPEHNFITSTGLSMAFRYAFADCFRYLSLGLGDTPNTIVGQGTTGLAQPLGPPLAYIGGRTSYSDPTTSQYVSAGFVEKENVVSLYRSWRVPPGEDTFATPYTFKEFMLSPGRPGATGIKMAGANSSFNYQLGSPLASYLGASTVRADPSPSWNNDEWVGCYVSLYDSYGNSPQIRLITSNTLHTLTVSPNFTHYTNGGGYQFDTNSLYTYFTIHEPFNVCYCENFERDLFTTQYVYGPDVSAIADEYDQRNTPICSQTGAFVRVVRDIGVSAGDYLLLTYTLDVTVDSGINQFYFPANIVGRSINEDNWNSIINNVSGVSALIHHGLKLINPGGYTAYGPWGPMPQPSTKYYASYEVGESFVSSWGCPLEPYTKSINLDAYITTDYLQFAVNSSGGGAANNPYSGQSGVMAWRKTPNRDALGGFPARFYNIRQPNNEGSLYSINETPSPLNYRTYSTSPLNDFGFDISWARQTPVGGVSISIETYSAAQRDRSIQRNMEFGGPPISILPNPPINKSIRCMVLSYKHPSYAGYHIPYMDIGFADTGLHLNPDIDRYLGAYNQWHLDTGDNGNGTMPKWNYLPNDAKLNFYFRLSWQSDA